MKWEDLRKLWLQCDCKVQARKNAEVQNHHQGKGTEYKATKSI